LKFLKQLFIAQDRIHYFNRLNEEPSEVREEGSEGRTQAATPTKTTEL